MIRNPSVGDRITAPGWPTRKAGTIVEIRGANPGSRSRQIARIIVHLDGAEDVPRVFDTKDLDREAQPDRPRRKSAGYRR